MRKTWTLSNKLMLIAGTAIGVTLLGFTGVTGWNTAERTRRHVLEIADGKADAVTAQTSVVIDEAMSAGTSAAAMLSGFMSSGPMRKADAVAALKMLLETHPHLFGSWMSDTVDKRAEPHMAGSSFENKAGVFTPYWTKQNDATLAFDTFPVEPDEAWYRDPIASGKSLLIEPYVPPPRATSSPRSPPRSR